MRTLLLMLLATALALPMLAQTDRSAPEFGYLNGYTYTNEYWRFNIQLPEGWHIADEAELNEFTEEEETLIDSDSLSEETSEALEKLKEQFGAKEYMLFQVSSGESEDDFDSQFMGTAEKLALLAQADNESEYIDAIVSHMGVMATSGSAKVKNGKTKLGGRKFRYRILTWNIFGVNIHQEIIVHKARKDEYLTFILLYTSKEQRKVMYKSLRTLEFR